MALVYGPGRFTKGQQSELAGMQHTDGNGGTFAHEQHSRPQKRFLGHRRYVKTLGTGMLQTGAALASLSVILRERSMNPDARTTIGRYRIRVRRWRHTYKSRHSFCRAKARERKGMICACCSARPGSKAGAIEKRVRPLVQLPTRRRRSWSQ